MMIAFPGRWRAGTLTIPTGVIPVSTQSKTGTSSADAGNLPQTVEPWRNQALEVPVFARFARAKPG
jgi:hypothetical protein